MVKRLIAAYVVILLAGCSTIKDDNSAPVVQKVPVVYCPAPLPFERPVLPIEDDTIEAANPGEIAKKYKATVKTLQGYIKELEMQLENYKNVNKEYESMVDKP